MSSPFPSTPPTSPESVAGSGGSSASDPSPRKLTYRPDEDPAPSAPSSPQAAAAVAKAAVVATRKAGAEKSRWRFLPANPLGRWLAANHGGVGAVVDRDGPAPAAAKAIGISEREMTMPEQATIVSGNVGVVAPSSVDVEQGRSEEEDAGKAPSFAKEEMEEEKVVTASLMTVKEAPTSTKDEKEGVRAANGDDATAAGVLLKRESDALMHSYFQKNLYWQRIRRQKQIAAAAMGGGGIFRSGRSEYYGTQPEDNEHSFAVVLSEMETQKKREQEEEMKKKKRREEEEEEEKKRQPAAIGTLLGFHALVIKLVREGESILESDRATEVSWQLRNRIISSRPYSQNLYFRLCLCLSPLNRVLSPSDVERMTQ